MSVIEDLEDSFESMHEGNILWYSQRDGNGIIVDLDGNEYYFDDSTIINFELKIKPNDFVIFRPYRVDGVLTSGVTFIPTMLVYLAYKLIYFKVHTYCNYDNNTKFREYLDEFMDFLEEEKTSLIKHFNLKKSKELYEQSGNGKTDYQRFMYQTLIIYGSRERYEFGQFIRSIKTFINKSPTKSKKLFQFLGVDKL